MFPGTIFRSDSFCRLFLSIAMTKNFAGASRNPPTTRRTHTPNHSDSIIQIFLLWTHGPDSLPLLWREIPRKRCPWGREDGRGAVSYSVARNPSISVASKARDRRWSWLGHVLRTPEHCLMRRVLLKCAKPTHETLFAEVPNLNVD